jgi:hypothetical protein
MAFVARWGKSAKTTDRSDWVCNRSLNKVGLFKEKDICSSGTVIVLPPASGPSSLSAVQLVPASGPGNLSSTLLPPAAGPSRLSASANPPASGPSGLSATPGAPAAGPSSLVASLQPPAAGPGGLSAIKPPSAGPGGLSSTVTLNIAPLESDQSTFADTPSTGTAGDIKYSSDTDHLYIHDGTEWHHTKGRQPGETYTVINDGGY